MIDNKSNSIEFCLSDCDEGNFQFLTKKIPNGDAHKNNEPKHPQNIIGIAALITAASATASAALTCHLNSSHSQSTIKSSKVIASGDGACCINSCKTSVTHKSLNAFGI